MRRHRPTALITLSIAAILLSGCSTASTPVPGATRIEVKVSDALKIEPAAFTVKAGSPVTFVVTNTGALEHEFFVGDDKAQADHDKEMTGMTAMTMDEPMGIGIKPGHTKELTVTLTPSAGTLFAGCHIQGHYAAGMKANITVQ